MAALLSDAIERFADFRFWDRKTASEESSNSNKSDSGDINYLKFTEYKKGTENIQTVDYSNGDISAQLEFINGQQVFGRWTRGVLEKKYGKYSANGSENSSEEYNGLELTNKKQKEKETGPDAIAQLDQELANEPDIEKRRAIIESRFKSEEFIKGLNEVAAERVLAVAQMISYTLRIQLERQLEELGFSGKGMSKQAGMSR